MPKVRPVESRRGFLGGLNISVPSDMLNDDELLQCVNARIDTFGGIMRRPGSVKLNETAFANAWIQGVFQWTPPSGLPREVVAVADVGKLIRGQEPYDTFTIEGALGIFTTNTPCTFALFRTSADPSIVLFIAANGTIYTWDGSALTQRSGTASVPNAYSIRAFGTRLFANDTGATKTIYWSDIGEGDQFSTGGVADGGSAVIDILGGEKIVAMEAVGSSLLIATNESIARFTGVADDIQILQDTQGVSAEIGPSGARHYNFLRMGEVVFMHSDRGIYVANEGGVLNIGKKIFNPSQSALRMSTNVLDQGGSLMKPIVGYNPRRSEAWYIYCPVGGTRRTHALVYNFALQCWYGPFIYPFNMTCTGVFEDADGIEQLMVGCDDGHIRLLDSPDADSFDDGETDFDCVVQFAPFGLKDGPHTTKTLDHVFLQVIGDHTFTVTATGDLGLTDVGSFIS